MSLRWTDIHEQSCLLYRFDSTLAVVVKEPFYGSLSVSGAPFGRNWVPWKTLNCTIDLFLFVIVIREMIKKRIIVASLSPSLLKM